MTSRACLHLTQPDHSAGKVHKAHEGWKCFLAAQGDAAEPLEFVEEALDMMTLPVQPPVDVRPHGAARIGFDLRGRAEFIGDEGAQRISIVGGIGDDMAHVRQSSQKISGLRRVAMLPRRRVDADR